MHTEPEAHNRELGTNKNRVAPIYQIHAQKLAQIDGKASKAEPGGGGGRGGGSYFHTYISNRYVLRGSMFYFLGLKQLVVGPRFENLYLGNTICHLPDRRSTPISSHCHTVGVTLLCQEAGSLHSAGKYKAKYE